MIVIRTVSLRWFFCRVTTYVLNEKLEEKKSPNHYQIFPFSGGIYFIVVVYQSKITLQFVRMEKKRNIKFSSFIISAYQEL